MAMLFKWAPWALVGLLPLVAEPVGRSLEAHRTLAPVVLDGRLDEPAWAAAASATGFTVTWPQFGRAAALPTVVKVLYDDRYLYVGARMQHPKGHAKVIQRLHRRDQDSASDWFTVFLDTLKDRRTALAFAVNASGVQRDALYSGDSNAGDTSWDGVWESAVSRDPDGWTAELKIPLSQLRIKGAGGAQVWGINFNRSDQGPFRENSYWELPPRGVNAFVSRFPDLTGITGIHPLPRREWVPFLTLQRKFETAKTFDDRGWQLRGGLDAHLSLSPNSQLDLSARPDFAQVEVDQAVLNLGTYETYFQEKRPFFLEGMELFQVAGPTLFYSRRIGKALAEPSLAAGEILVSSPATADIAGAAKYTAKLDSGLNLGFLAAGVEAAQGRVQSGGQVQDRQLSPYTSFGVLRVQQLLDDRGSYLGGFGSFMREAGTQGREATVTALDSVYKSSDRSQVLETTLVRSLTGPRDAQVSGARERVRYNRQWRSGYSLEVQGINATRDYDPNDVGALARSDDRRAYVALTRQYDGALGPLRSRNWGVDFLEARDQAGLPYQRAFSTWARTDFYTFYSLWGSAGMSLPVQDDRELRTFRDPVKKYLHTPHLPYVQMGFDTPGNRAWYGRITADTNWFQGAPTTNVDLFQSIKLTTALELQLDTGFRRELGELRYLETQGTTPIVGLRQLSQLNQTLRVAYALNPRLTVQAFTQVLVANWNYRALQSYVNDTTLAPGATSSATAFSDRLWNVNLIVRWEFRPGSACYFVYTHGTSTEALVNARATISPRLDLPILRHLPSDDVVQLKVSWLIR